MGKNLIKKVVVLGASGTLGGLIGGMLAQNEIQVWFLSRTTEGAQKGLARAQKYARSKVISQKIQFGSYDEFLEDACRQADWILECVAENIAVKKHIYALIDNYRNTDSIVSSVTSSLNIEDLPKGRSKSFKKNFLSTHFYNPPNKMVTNPAAVDYMTSFCASKLRRTVIPVKPTPSFAGNRIAFLMFSRVVDWVIEYGVEMIDCLIGPYTGRLMAPLATLDLVGLDIYQAIIHNIHAHVHDIFHDRLLIPDYIETMITKGHIGNKTPDKGGFYKRLESGKFMYFDPKSMNYINAFYPHIQFVEKAKNLIHLGLYKQAFEIILSAIGPEANIVHEYLATYIAYSYMLVGQVTDEKYGIEAIDRVMTAGFNWACPSLVVYMLGGKKRAIELLKSQNLSIPCALMDDRFSNQFYFNAGKYFPAM